MHHIDDDPSNNEPDNLIPLCPNCHLVDQHNPTAPVDPIKLRLFRQHKDPLILSPQFQPVFRRFAYLFQLDSEFDHETARLAAIELVAFINALKMGGFYHVQVAELLTLPDSDPVPDLLGKPDHVWTARFRARDERSKAVLLKNRDRAIELIVEMLRYQDWQYMHPRANPLRNHDPAT